jgi:hypothetical protein
MVHLQGFTQGEFQDFLGPGREGDMAGGRILAVADDFLDLFTHSFQGDAQLLQGLRGDAFAFVEQAEQDVLGADLVVIEHLRLVLRQDDDATGSVGKAFKHWNLLDVRPEGRR